MTESIPADKFDVIFGTSESLIDEMIDMKANDLLRVNGCTFYELQKAFILLDHIIGRGQPLYNQPCNYCASGCLRCELKECEQSCLNQLWFKMVVFSIDRTVIHELIHLCGEKSEYTTELATKAIHPFPDVCPYLVVADGRVDHFEEA